MKKTKESIGESSTICAKSSKRRKVAESINGGRRENEEEV
jgi:hypothetical protein